MLSNLLDITGFFVSVLINLLLIALICYYFKRKIDNLEYSQSEQAKTLYTLISQQNNMMAVNNESNSIVMGANNIMSGLDLTQLNQNSSDENDDDNNDNNDSDTTNEESGSECDDESILEEESETDEQTISGMINMVPVEEDSKQIEYSKQYEGVQEGDIERSENIFIGHQETLEEPESVEEPEIVEEPESVENQIAEEQQVEPNIDSTDENYEKMTVKELKNVLAGKGVHAKSSMNKSDIISILKGASNIALELEDGDVQ